MVQVGATIVFPQWFAGFGVTMVLLQMGFMGGWPSPTLARLTAPGAEIPLSPNEASWVASLVNLGRFPGAILGSVLASYLGSKRTILVVLFPMAAGWLVIALAKSVIWLYVGRLFSGLGLGMAYSVFALYLGEVSIPSIRGALISLATVGSPVGQLISSIAGTYLSLSESAFGYFTMALLLMGAFIWLPESPHHLVKVGQREAARKSIDWYRAGKGVEEELDAVEKFIAADSSTSFADKLRSFKKPAVKRATYQVIALFAFMQICGLNSIVFYMETILTRAKATLISPGLVVIYVNVCGIFGAILSMFVIDRFGRRILLAISGSGVSLSMIGLMTHFLLMDFKVDTTSLQWLPMLSMFLFIISFCVGMMPVPNTILSETFPANIKCIAASIGSLMGATMSFLSSKTYQPMVDAMGEAYVFLTYAILSTIVIPYAIFVLMETKGKTLQEIQDELMKKK